MRNTATKFLQHLLIRRMLIPKEDVFFKARPIPKQSKRSVALYQLISLFSKSSWIKTTGSRLSYELGVNCEKAINKNWGIINKNGHSTFHNDKP